MDNRSDVIRACFDEFRDAVQNDLKSDPKMKPMFQAGISILEQFCLDVHSIALDHERLADQGAQRLHNERG